MGIILTVRQIANQDVFSMVPCEYWAKEFVSEILNFNEHTVECHHNVVQYNVIMHSSLQWLMQDINQSLNPQNTLHISP